MSPDRRHVTMSLLAGALASPLIVLSAQGKGLPASLLPKPSCVDDDEPTPAQTEGPYFTANSPLRQDFGQDILRQLVDNEWSELVQYEKCSFAQPILAFVDGERMRAALSLFLASDLLEHKLHTDPVQLTLPLAQ